MASSTLGGEIGGYRPYFSVRPKSVQYVAHSTQSSTLGRLGPKISSSSPSVSYGNTAQSNVSPISAACSQKALKKSIERKFDDLKKKLQPGEILEDVRFEIKSRVNLDEKVQEALELRYGKLRIDFTADLEKLIVKAMPSGPHEACTWLFYEFLREALGDDKPKCSPRGSQSKRIRCLRLESILKLVYHVAVGKVNDSKQPDSSIRPLRAADCAKEKRGKPTFYVEVGFSETWENLEEDKDKLFRLGVGGTSIARTMNTDTTCRRRELF